MEDSITETELKTGTEDFHQMDDGEVMKPSESTEQRKQEEEVEEGSKRSGGIVNHLISNLVTPSSPRLPRGLSNNFSATTEADYKEDEEENKSTVDVEMGGGIINNFISNIFQSSTTEGDQGEVKETRNNIEGVADVEERNGEHVKMEEEKSNGGIISNLVSNLEENYDPENDEASIMIHSIIHD